MFFDGLRFTIEHLDRSHARLVSGLTEVAHADRPGNVPDLFLDAWACVDAGNRLRVLLQQTPGLKKNTPPLRVLMTRLGALEDLRNPIQHLPGAIQDHAVSDTPTWGVLHWFWADDALHGRALFLYPGAIRKTRGPSMLAPSSLPKSNPDHITLAAYGVEADLSELHRAVAAFVPLMEESLAVAFEPYGEALMGSDALITIELGSASTPRSAAEKP